MTFRPSDDLLDEVTNSQGSSGFFGQNNMLMEEVKAPDLSELLKNGDNFDNSPVESGMENGSDIDGGVVIQTNEEEKLSVNNGSFIDNKVNDNNQLVEENMQVNSVNSGEFFSENKENQNLQIDETKQKDITYFDEDKLSDEERINIVSGIEGSVHSNLDLLVDNDWSSIIGKYKQLNRLFFRWGIYCFVTIIGIFFGVYFQVKANNLSNILMIDDSSIENKSKWVGDTADVIMSPLIGDGIDINVIIPYGAASLDGSSFQSKSNLISYRGIILPQLASIDYESEEFISLADFNAQKTSREDIKNLINSLIIKNSIYIKTRNLQNAEDSRWVSNNFQSSLLEDFNLGCFNNNKVSDFVCDKFVQNFYKYGKYYDLILHSAEVLDLVKGLKQQSKDVNPICNMVNDYVLHVGNFSDTFLSIMNYCDVQDSIFYRKISKFIELENSLRQPELSDKVFDDSDLNAYKLLSAQQSVYKIIDGTSLNEDYIKSYLSFVQNLINKDKGNNTYLLPIYKDVLYVFNMDEIYQKLLQKGKLSSDIKMQIDKINNGNVLSGFPSLISQLTTSDIIQKEGNIVDMEVEKRSLDDLFSQYYAMVDRLKIRRVYPISENQIKVQTEMFTDKILSVTNGETLKLTVMLNRQDNLLYVDNIKVVNQKNLTDILNIYVSEGNITFNAILNYIEEQIGMRYELEPEEIDFQPTLCEQLQERTDISIYNCDDSSILLYKGDVEYSFILENGILISFDIDDENLDSVIKSKLDGVIFMRDDTPTIITSIVDFVLKGDDDPSFETKLSIVNQFRIHFKLVPDDIHDIEGKSNEFLVDFTLGEFKLQGYYNVDTHLLTKISYVACDKKLGIKNLTIEITTENESQLIEILNNPKVFFAQANSVAYKKYQKMCNTPVDDK